MSTKQDTRTDRPSVTPESVSPSDAPRSLAELGVAAAGATVESAGAAVPTVQPPGSAAPPPSVAAVGAVTGTWQVDRRISALWTNPSPRNAWLYVVGLGWRKISPATDSSVIAMTAIGSLARQTNARVDFVEESDGTISQLTIW